VPFQNTVTRLWKRLTPPERLEAAVHFWKEPPADMAASAMGVLVRARHMRPQAVRALSVEEKARALSQVLDPGESLVATLLVALHLGSRRALLGAFLDLLGIPHEEGVLKEEAGQLSAPTPEQVKSAVLGLAAKFAPHEVETYLNTLWLQDPDHWGALEGSSEWISGASQPSSPPKAP
jgi:hypothetical protein